MLFHFQASVLAAGTDCWWSGWLSEPGVRSHRLCTWPVEYKYWGRSLQSSRSTAMLFGMLHDWSRMLSLQSLGYGRVLLSERVYFCSTGLLPRCWNTEVSSLYYICFIVVCVAFRWIMNKKLQCYWSSLRVRVFCGDAVMWHAENAEVGFFFPPLSVEGEKATCTISISHRKNDTTSEVMEAQEFPIENVKF